jgi:hypothetical protein
MTWMCRIPIDETKWSSTKCMNAFITEGRRREKKEEKKKIIKRENNLPCKLLLFFLLLLLIIVSNKIWGITFFVYFFIDIASDYRFLLCLLSQISTHINFIRICNINKQQYKKKLCMYVNLDMAILHAYVTIVTWNKEHKFNRIAIYIYIYIYIDFKDIVKHNINYPNCVDLFKVFHPNHLASETNFHHCIRKQKYFSFPSIVLKFL